MKNEIKTMTRFQFLIGKVQPVNNTATPQNHERFQFLIGKVQQYMADI